MLSQGIPPHVMSQYKSLATLLMVATVVLAMVAVAPATAHESEEIDGYELTFGGADEPVITGERMWLQLSIVDEDGEPVSDQAETLQWQVEKPGEEDPVALEVSEAHGDPGVYEAPVVFTEPGEYVIHIEGTVENTEVHTHFEKEVEDHTALQYPEESQMDEIESELEHQHDGLHELQEQVEELEEQVEAQESQEDAESEQTAATVPSSWVVGAVAAIGLLGAGLVAIQRQR